MPSPHNAAPDGANRRWVQARAPVMRYPEKEPGTMTTIPWLDEEEARRAIRGPKGWSIVLDKQWSAPTFPKGG